MDMYPVGTRVEADYLDMHYEGTIAAFDDIQHDYLIKDDGGFLIWVSAAYVAKVG